MAPCFLENSGIDGKKGHDRPQEKGFDQVRKEALSRLYASLGLDFQSLFHLHLALIHKSWAGENPGTLHNERMEFFGDAILDFIIVEELYNRYPNWNEGRLSRMKAYLVSEPQLAKMAKTLNLGDYILLGAGEKKDGARKKSLLADAFEAVLCAVFMDGGLLMAKDFVLSLFRPLLDQLGESVVILDHKSKLQEYLQQRYGKRPEYSLISSSGPSHKMIFVMEVTFGDIILGRGQGASKKEAEQDSAAQALEFIGDGGLDGLVFTGDTDIK